MNFDKVKTFFKQFSENSKGFYLLIALSVFVIIIVVLIQIFSGDETNDSQLVDQPFNYDDNVEITVSDSVVKDVEITNKANLYNIDKTDNSILVQNFLNKIGKGFWRKTNFDDIYYVWSEDGGVGHYLADYDISKDSIFFRFEDPLELDEIENIDYKIDTAPTLLMDEVLLTYFDIDVELEDPEVSTYGNEIRMSTRRLIDDIPVEVRGNDSFSYYFVFDIAGRLKEGQVLLTSFVEPEKVRIFDIEYLGNSINQKAYPKDIIAKLPSDFDLEDLGYEPYEYAEGFYGDPPPYEFDDEDLIPEECTVTAIELVYYFVRTSVEKLTPVYKLGCRGEVTIEEQTYLVPLTIFANALDPELVYVPGIYTQE